MISGSGGDGGGRWEGGLRELLIFHWYLYSDDLP